MSTGEILNSSKVNPDLEKKKEKPHSEEPEEHERLLAFLEDMVLTGDPDAIREALSQKKI